MHVNVHIYVCRYMYSLIQFNLFKYIHIYVGPTDAAYKGGKDGIIQNGNSLHCLCILTYIMC